MATGSRHRAPAVLVAAVLVAALLAGCGAAGGPAGGPGDDAGVTVVATTTILGDIASRIVGDEGRVEVLLPIGADPHDFQISARQATRLREATLVVANGLGLEAGLGDVLETAEADGAVVIRVAPLVDPLPFGGHDEDHEESGDHDEDNDDHGDLDPHVWFDPLRMADGVSVIGEALAEAAPGGGWEDRAAAYRAELEALHAEVAAILETVPSERRLLVTNHDSFGYLAERYGYSVIGTVITGGSTQAEPSARDLAELTETIVDTGVTAIFVETTEPSALAEAVAAEVGRPVAVVELFTGSLGGPGSGAETYVDLLRTDARSIAEALAG